MLNFKDIIDPISVEDFQKHYDAQQHFVIRGDKSRYEWIYNWNDFDKYMNGFPKNCGDLQIIAYNDNLRDKWCKKKIHTTRGPRRRGWRGWRKYCFKRK